MDEDPARAAALAVQLTRTAFERLIALGLELEALADRLAVTSVDPVAVADWLAWKEKNPR